MTTAIEQFKANHFSEEEMAEILGITVKTLKNRVYTGTNHPPFFNTGPRRWFPKDEFDKWMKDRIEREIAPG